MIHRVGRFNTPEEAFAQIPADSKSHDWEGDVIWYYTVECMAHDAVPADVPQNVPARFPYRGW